MIQHDPISVTAGGTVPAMVREDPVRGPMPYRVPVRRSAHSARQFNDMSVLRLNVLVVDAREHSLEIAPCENQQQPKKK